MSKITPPTPTTKCDHKFTINMAGLPPSKTYLVKCPKCGEIVEVEPTPTTGAVLSESHVVPFTTSPSSPTPTTGKEEEL